MLAPWDWVGDSGAVAPCRPFKNLWKDDVSKNTRYHRTKIDRGESIAPAGTRKGPINKNLLSFAMHNASFRIFYRAFESRFHVAKMFTQIRSGSYGNYEIRLQIILLVLPNV